MMSSCPPISSMGWTEQEQWPDVLTNAVHICHIMTRAPRIGAGAHSAA